MTEVVIVSAARSAVARGKADGALAGVHPVDLSSTVMKAAIDRAGIDPAIIEDVQWIHSTQEIVRLENGSHLSISGPTTRNGQPSLVPWILASGSTVRYEASSSMNE